MEARDLAPRLPLLIESGTMSLVRLLNRGEEDRTKISMVIDEIFEVTTVANVSSSKCSRLENKEAHDLAHATVNDNFFNFFGCFLYPDLRDSNFCRMRLSLFGSLQLLMKRLV